MTTTLAPEPTHGRTAAGPAPTADRHGADPDHRTGRPARGAIGRLVRGRPDDPAWVRPALFALLGATAVLYLWGLGASGWANAYYSAAVQASTHSWKAWFFGSFDSGNAITVDKAPGALWVMGLSARVFGVNAWSILVPQALEGVAAVGVLYLAVRRWFSPGAGLLAGTVLALTPVATLMFRFNNPDALLVLLLTGAAYAVVRALEQGQTRWLALAGTLVGFGFLAKMLQAFVLLPVLAGVYLLAGPPKLGRRLWQVAVLGLAALAAGGWWVAVVEWWPGAKPYVGGSQDGSTFNLLFGYNGFGRLTGDEAGSVGGGGGTTGRWGATGWSRLFGSEMGSQASWLIPAALILAAACLALRWRAPRTDRARAAVLLWVGWLLLTGAVFSYGKGIIHPYYTVALAPAIGALVGIGAACWWARRHDPVARTVLAGALVATTSWAAVLLGRTSGWHPELRAFVAAGGVLAGLALLVGPLVRHRLGPAVAAGALVVGLAAPAAYALDTAATTHAGALPSAGPSAGFGPGGGFGAGRPTAGPGGGPGGAAGSLLSGSSPSDELVATLTADDDGSTWLVATVGANQAAGYQLATDRAALAIGGFNGTDPSPTLAQFQAWVRDGRIHWFVGGGTGGFGPGSGASSSEGTASAITAWVEANATARTVDGITLYDLSALAS